MYIYVYIYIYIYIYVYARPKVAQLDNLPRNSVSCNVTRHDASSLQVIFRKRAL